MTRTLVHDVTITRMKLIVFDVETKKAFDEVGGYHPKKLGVSISGVYYLDQEKGEEWLKGYKEDEFGEMFKLFEQADLIVGFNSVQFDLEALAPYYVGDLQALPNLDIMLEMEKELGYRPGLDAVAKETLGRQKIGKGLDALEYFHKGEWEKLEKYCLRDVEVTRDLYFYGLDKKMLVFKNKWNRVIEVPVKFDELPVRKNQVQTTLF